MSNKVPGSAAQPLRIGMDDRCGHCGKPIHVTNFALGLGWIHTDSRSSQCQIFAAPKGGTHYDRP